MSQHVTDFAGRVTDWYVARLQAEDPEAGERAAQIIARSVARDRSRLGLVQHRAAPARHLCGCAASLEIESDGSCPRCSAPISVDQVP